LGEIKQLSIFRLSALKVTSLGLSGCFYI